MMRSKIFFALWAVLILAGIVGKRVFLQPDLMVFFHLPAAVFLVLGWYEASRKYRLRHRAASARRLGSEAVTRSRNPAAN